MTNSMILEKLSSLGPSREYVVLMVKGKENIFPYLNFVCCHIVLLELPFATQYTRETRSQLIIH